jgi:hypothetical protein
MTNPCVQGKRFDALQWIAALLPYDRLVTFRAKVGQVCRRRAAGRSCADSRLMPGIGNDQSPIDDARLRTFSGKSTLTVVRKVIRNPW